MPRAATTESASNVDNKSATRSASERRAGEKEIQSGSGGRYGCHCVRAGVGRPIPAMTPTRPDPKPGLLISPLFIFYFFTLFFLRSHRSKKRLFLWTPKFSVMNFRILWSHLFLGKNEFCLSFRQAKASKKLNEILKNSETQFCREFVLSFLFGTNFTDNSNILKSFS